jgi:hypothetical protein
LSKRWWKSCSWWVCCSRTVVQVNRAWELRFMVYGVCAFSYVVTGRYAEKFAVCFKGV